MGDDRPHTTTVVFDFGLDRHHFKCTCGARSRPGPSGKAAKDEANEHAKKHGRGAQR